MTSKKRIIIKNKKLKQQIKTEEKKNIKKDFFELLRRAATPLENK